MIEIKNLNKSFTSNSDTFHALKDINLSIKKSSLVIIKGKSGSGKSTLLSIIASIMKPTSGAVLIDEENIVSLSDIHLCEYRKLRVGFITQSFHLFDELTLKENLLPSLIMRDLTASEIEEAIDIALNIAHIKHKKKQKVHTLSGGEKQRCIIARAVVNNPDIIICDEPTANLDAENSLAFIERLKELKSLGKTIIVATHDPLFDNLDFVDNHLNMRDGTLG